MGTKHCPETPRQKMINMMYLVLTAMLALNVAAETLHAFKIVDKSLMKTYLTFTDKNKSLLTDFKHQYELNANKVQKWMDLANEVNAHSDSLVYFLIDTKEELALAADGQFVTPETEVTDEFPIIINRDQDSIVLKRQDDLNVSPELMLTRGRGVELQNKINEFKDYLKEIVKDNPVIIENLESSLDVSDPERDNLKLDKGQTMNFRTWPQQNFEATPVIASITLLSKLQIDVRNAESAVLRYLYNQIDASSFKFTGLKATVIPDASFIFQGQEYRARIFLSAEDTTQELEVYVDGSNQPLRIEGNEAIYSFTPSEARDYTYKGQIKYMNPDGDGFNYIDFEESFEVAKPTATVSATKMNVLFKDLDNPIDISVPGVSSDDIDPICTNGTMEKIGDEWIVKPAELDFTGDNTRIEVYAELGGERRKMYEATYRVMRVPNPIAKVSGISSGTISPERLRIQQVVSADLEDFYFDLRFEVTSFVMTVPSGGGYTQQYTSNSYRFTDDMKQVLNRCGPGDKVMIESIKAKIQGDESDEVRQLAPIILTVQ